MQDHKRNLAVGVFVLIGCLALAGLVLAFSSIATVFKSGYTIQVRMEHAHGLGEGRVVHYRGLRVGEVEEIRFDEELNQVIARVRIREPINIPAGAMLFAAPATFGEVFADIRVPTDREDMPGYLPQDGSGVIPGRSAPPQLIPPELAEQLEQTLEGLSGVKDLVENLKLMTEQRRLADVRAGRVPPNLNTTIERIDESVAKLASDENVEHLNESLARMRRASQSLQQTMEKADVLIERLAVTNENVNAAVIDVQERSAALMSQLTDDAIVLERLLTNADAVVAGVRRGEGTMGRLLRSDQFHRELELTLMQVRQAMRDFSRLSVKLEEEGLLRRGG